MIALLRAIRRGKVWAHNSPISSSYNQRNDGNYNHNRNSDADDGDSRIMVRVIMILSTTITVAKTCKNMTNCKISGRSIVTVALPIVKIKIVAVVVIVVLVKIVPTITVIVVVAIAKLYKRIQNDN